MKTKMMYIVLGIQGEHDDISLLIRINKAYIWRVSASLFFVGASNLFGNSDIHQN